MLLILSFFVFTSIGFSANKKIADNNTSINELNNRIEKLRKALDLTMKSLELYQRVKGGYDNVKEHLSKEIKEGNPKKEEYKNKISLIEKNMKTLEEMITHQEKEIESIQNNIAQLEKQLMLEHSKRRLQFCKKKQIK